MKEKRPFISATTTADLIRERDGLSPGFKARVEAHVRELGIARQVKSLRKASGLGQVALAKKAGTAQAVIARIENGHIPRIELLSRVADALGAELNVQIRARPAKRKAASGRRSALRVAGT